MPKYKTAIKIVRKRSKGRHAFSMGKFEKGDLTSAFDDGLVIVYRKRHWTKRNGRGGPLAIFDTTKNALKFLLGNTNPTNNELQMFECKYKESTEKSLYFRSRITNQVLKLMSYCNMPEGTVFADEVKITKRIQ